MIDRLDTTPFLNKRIVLVGLASRMTNFKKNISKVKGMNFTHLTGDESELELYKLLDGAEYVLISTEENGHSGSYSTAKVCNSLNIPFTSTYGKGLTSVLMDLKKLIDNTEKARIVG